MHERVIGSDINAGGNLTIQTKKIDGALIAGGDVVNAHSANKLG